MLTYSWYWHLSYVWLLVSASVRTARFRIPMARKTSSDGICSMGSTAFRQVCTNTYALHESRYPRGRRAALASATEAVWSVMVVRSVSDSLPGTPGPPSLDGGRFGRNDLCQHVERGPPLATPRALPTTHLAQLAVAMLRPTLIRAAHVHKPLIRFPDRRAPKSMCLSASGPSN